MPKEYFPKTTLVATLAFAALAFSACSSADPEATVQAETSSATTSPSGGGRATDADSCRAMSDVLTILQNASSAFNQGRISEREYDGWLSLATRVLAIVPVRGEGAISADVTMLQTSTPPSKTALNGASPIAEANWTDGVNLAEDCAAAGESLDIRGFAGG